MTTMVVVMCRTYIQHLLGSFRCLPCHNIHPVLHLEHLEVNGLPQWMYVCA